MSVQGVSPAVGEFPGTSHGRQTTTVFPRPPGIPPLETPSSPPRHLRRRSGHSLRGAPRTPKTRPTVFQVHVGPGPGTLVHRSRWVVWMVRVPRVGSSRRHLPSLWSPDSRPSWVSGCGVTSAVSSPVTPHGVFLPLLPPQVRTEDRPVDWGHLVSLPDTQTQKEGSSLPSRG